MYEITDLSFNAMGVTIRRIGRQRTHKPSLTPVRGLRYRLSCKRSSENAKVGRIKAEGLIWLMNPRRRELDCSTYKVV